MTTTSVVDLWQSGPLQDEGFRHLPQQNTILSTTSTATPSRHPSEEENYFYPPRPHTSSKSSHPPQVNRVGVRRMSSVPELRESQRGYGGIPLNPHRRQRSNSNIKAREGNDRIAVEVGQGGNRLVRQKSMERGIVGHPHRPPPRGKRIPGGVNRPGSRNGPNPHHPSAPNRLPPPGLKMPLAFNSMARERGFTTGSQPQQQYHQQHPHPPPHPHPHPYPHQHHHHHPQHQLPQFQPQPSPGSGRNQQRIPPPIISSNLSTSSPDLFENRQYSNHRPHYREPPRSHPYSPQPMLAAPHSAGSSPHNSFGPQGYTDEIRGSFRSALSASDMNRSSGFTSTSETATESSNAMTVDEAIGMYGSDTDDEMYTSGMESEYRRSKGDSVLGGVGLDSRKGSSDDDYGGNEDSALEEEMSPLSPLSPLSPSHHSDIGEHIERELENRQYSDVEDCYNIGIATTDGTIKFSSVLVSPSANGLKDDANHLFSGSEFHRDDGEISPLSVAPPLISPLPSPPLEQPAPLDESLPLSQSLPPTKPQALPQAQPLPQSPPPEIDRGSSPAESIEKQRTPPPVAEPVEPRDRYGFRKQTQYVTLAEYEEWEARYEETLDRRRKKWDQLLRESGLTPGEGGPVRFPPKSAKIKRYVRKGIPPEWRGAAWFWYAGGQKYLNKHPGLYDDLVKQGPSPPDAELIERDLHRTFPDNIKFKPDPPPGMTRMSRMMEKQFETPVLQQLRRVLIAFALHVPKIGYCQSLNFLAGLLLLFMSEERAFWMLYILTQSHLPGTHEMNLEGSSVDQWVLMTSIRECLPQIWTKIGGGLDGGEVDMMNSTKLPPVTLCTSSWFMSGFIGSLPIESVLRVWDCLFYEGSKTLFRIALTVFKTGEPQIKAVNDPMEIFQVVQTIPRKLLDAGALIEACYRRRNGFGHLSQETINQKRQERRDVFAEERALVATGVRASRDDGVLRRVSQTQQLPRHHGELGRKFRKILVKT